MEVIDAAAILEANNGVGYNDLYCGTKLCNSCKVKPPDPKCLLTCSGCHCVSYCNADCQRSHWKAGHKLMCKMRKELMLIMESNFAVPDAKAAREFCRSVSEERMPAVLALEKDPKECAAGQDLQVWMQKVIEFKREDLAKMALSFKEEYDRAGLQKNKYGDVFLRKGHYTLLVDFKCEDQPALPSPLMNWQSGAVTHGYASPEDMRANPTLRRMVKSADPATQFVIIPQTRQGGGKTGWDLGRFDGKM